MALDPLDVEVDAHGVRVLLANEADLEPLRALLGLPEPAELEVAPWPGRDHGSVHRLTPRPVTVAGFRLVPVLPGEPARPPSPDALLLPEGTAFGTGLHPTTALCLAWLAEVPVPDRVLDVGTGSGILGLAAIRAGASSVLGVDTDPEAVAAAREAAALNGVTARFEVRHGGLERVDGRWPLILANLLAGPLLGLAHPLARVLAPGGELVLSGIPAGLAAEVAAPYRTRGFRMGPVHTDRGWARVVLRAGW